MIAKTCFLCGKPLTRSRKMADTRDDQIVYVGPDCYRKIEAAGDAGLATDSRPGFVRLYPTRQISDAEVNAYIKKLAAMDRAAGIE